MKKYISLFFFSAILVSCEEKSPEKHLFENIKEDAQKVSKAVEEEVDQSKTKLNKNKSKKEKKKLKDLFDN